MGKTVLAAVLFVAACSSSGVGGRVAHTVSPTPQLPSAATYATTAEAVAASCTAYSHFLDVLNQQTPTGDPIVLNDAASPVLSDLLHTVGALDESARRQLDDATTFVGHVGSSAFHSTGRPDDPEITAMADDCG